MPNPFTSPNQPGSRGFSSLRDGLLAAQSYPHVRETLRRILMERGIDQSEVERQADEWSRTVVLYLIALLDAVREDL
jgi:hypothetical protein